MKEILKDKDAEAKEDKLLISVAGGETVLDETAMNKDSSRSHSIFTIYIETEELDETGE